MPEYSLSSPFRCVNRAENLVFGILVMSNMTIKTSQCDHCVFKLIEDQSTPDSEKSVEDKYQAIRGAKGAPIKSKNTFIGGVDARTETCFIDSIVWEKRNENIHCPDRVDNALSLESALTLREAKSANLVAREARRIAKIALIIAAIATMIAAIPQICSIFS